MRFSRISTLLAWAVSAVPAVSAIQLSANPTKAELISAANQAKENMLTFYGGNRPGGIPGYMLNPDVYYWWLTGGMLGQLIHHWVLTGNDSTNDLVKTAIQFQSTDNKYLQPKNQSNSEGNDDQMFWAYAAMDAAEYNFPAPDVSTNISWLGLAQAVFNVQKDRWDDTHCGGGLRWQIYQWNKGWDYKNMPTNGGLFQIAARLARFTGNATYADEAERIWQWAEGQKLIAPNGDNKNALHVFDGFGDDKCSDGVNPVQFTYNPGAMLSGAAYMYNYTNGNETWRQRVVGLMEGLYNNQYLVQTAGTNDQNGQPQWGGEIMSESAMEFQTPQPLNSDQPSFKAYTIRWLAVAGQLVPSIQQNVSNIIRNSAQGAAQQCTGKAPGADPNATPAGLSTATPGTGSNWCGRRWYQNRWDGYSGFGEQMSAMSVFQNAILEIDGASVPAPLTMNTGGTSISVPDAGAGGNTNDPNNLPGGYIANRPITSGDKVGAAILTIIGLVLPPLALWFMLVGS